MAAMIALEVLESSDLLEFLKLVWVWVVENPFYAKVIVWAIVFWPVSFGIARIVRAWRRP